MSHAAARSMGPFVVALIASLVSPFPAWAGAPTGAGSDAADGGSRKVRAVRFTCQFSGEGVTKSYYASLKDHSIGKEAKGKLEQEVRGQGKLERDFLGRAGLLKRINKHMAEAGIAHADSAVAVSDLGSVPMRVEVEEWGYEYIKGGAHRFELRVRWTLGDAVSHKTVWSTTTKGSSGLRDEAPEGPAEAFSEALLKALDQLLGVPDFRAHLAPSDGPFSPLFREWPIIKVAGTVHRPVKANEAMARVVTVVRGKEYCSGVVLPGGYIVTSAQFVLRDSVVAPEVRFMDGGRESAEVVRTSAVSGLSLLRTSRTGDPGLAFAPDDGMALGDEVYAISTPSSIELGQSMSKGILSGTREFDGRRYLQTDVGISPGSSGGALVNRRGELVGILVAKVIGHSVQGLGFALPAQAIGNELKLDLSR